MRQEDTRATQPSPGLKTLVSVLIAIVLLGAALRLYGLGARSLWYDEANTFRVSQQVWPLTQQFNPDNTVEPPLLITLTHLWYALAHTLTGLTPGSVTCDFFLRLLPCIAGILGIPLTFLAGRAILKDDTTALLGAFLFAISPFQIYYAQELRAYTLHVVFATGALVFLVKALDANQFRHWLGWTLCLAVGIYNHFVMVWVMAALNVYFVATLPWHYKRLKPWVLSNIAAIGLSIPALRLALAASTTYEQAGQHWFPYPTLRIGLITFKDFFMGYSPNRIAYNAMLLLAGLLSLLGFFALRKRPRTVLLLAIAAFGPIAVTILYWRTSNFPYYVHRLMIFSAVPCYLLVAQGTRLVRRRLFTAVALALCAGLMVLALADHYGNRIHPLWDHRIGVRHKVDCREAAQFIAERLSEDDVIGHCAGYTHAPFRYYLERFQPRQRVLCFSQEGWQGVFGGYPNPSVYALVGLLPERIETFTASAPRVWLVESWWEPYDLDTEAELRVGWMDGHALRMMREPFEGLTVFLYRNAPDPKREMRTFQLADCGDWVVPYYFFPETPHDHAVGRQWRQSFVERFGDPDSEPPAGFALRFDLELVDRNSKAEFLDADNDGRLDTLALHGGDIPMRALETARIEGVDNALLAFDGEGRQAVLASFPLYCDDAFTYRFTVANATERVRTLECRVFESASVIEPLAFTRVNAASDVWRPVFQYDAGPPPGTFNSFGMLAKLGQDTPDGEAVYYDVRLDPGEYVIWARVIEVPDPVGYERAQTRFAIAPLDMSGVSGAFQMIGVTDGAGPSGHTGWAWHRIGAFRSEGEPVRLSISAHNPHHLPQAYFDLGRVMFVRQSESFEARSFEMRLGPFEQKPYVLSSRLGTYSSKRIDIEVFDTADREFRRIYFHLRRLTSSLGKEEVSKKKPSSRRNQVHKNAEVLPKSPQVR